MPTYKIGGVSVQFPYNAYDCQLVYMERVIHALQEGSNALLESPTGTGKTLCLLCATLAWRESLKTFDDKSGKSPGNQRDIGSPRDAPVSKLPTILYASRTHSQLHQVIRELKATTYRPKMIVLGSREQMCIHSEVQLMRGRVQNHTCRSMVKERKCRHHNRVTDYIKGHPELGHEPIDIEDLVSIGKAHGPCPYYLSRELHSSADIVFLPYNYLIDKDNRRSLTGINWEKTVLIFDEAHNLESLCADAASFDLPASHLAACIGEAKHCMELAISNRGMENAADTSIDPDNFAVLKALLSELEKRINEISLDSSEFGFTRPGSYMYEFLDSIKINWQTATILIDTIEQAINLLEDEYATGPAMHRRSPGTAYRLLSLRDALKLIFQGSETAHSSCYKVHIQEVRNKEGDKGGHRGTVAKASRTLSWWCFNPGIAMEEFAKMGIRSVILTSGTLAPLDSFAYELNLPFNVRLENPHVIDSSQIWVGVVAAGPSGRPLNSSYKTRDSAEYKQELGNTIVNFARIVPDGLLIFFPSYYLLNSCIDSWQSLVPGSSLNLSSIWERISKFKQPVVEPRESALFNQANESFMAKLSDKSSSGAVFFAVCRGKVSEGLDFADRAGRAVLITGIPYALKTDPKVRLKRDYLDEAIRSKPTNKRGITGGEWYVQQAARAVNQAVGRVIRHRHDYGAIILCDERFAQSNSQSQMSLWLRPHIKCYAKFGDAAFTLTKFFRDRVTADLPLLQKSLKDPKSTALEDRRRGLESTGADVLKSKAVPQAGQQLTGPFETNFFGFSKSRQPASELAVAQSSWIDKPSLNSVSIIQPNHAVGSTTGFVRAGLKISSQGRVAQAATGISLNAPASVTHLSQVNSSSIPESCDFTSSTAVCERDCKGQTSQVSTSLTQSSEAKPSNFLKKRALETSDVPVGFNKQLHRNSSPLGCSKADSPVARENNSGCRNVEGTTCAPTNKPINRPKSAADREGEPRREPPIKGASIGGEHHPSARRAQYLQKSRQQTVEGGGALGSISDQKTKDAPGFMREVKAHLSPLECHRFLECMRELKHQTHEHAVVSLLETVSNLFSAPERLFLFRRFGDFLPSPHRQLYEKCLATKCAELGFPSDLNSGQGSHGDNMKHFSGGDYLKPRLTSKSRKSGLNKKQGI